MSYHVCFDKSLIAKDFFYCKELELTLAGFAVLVASNTIYSEDSMTDFPAYYEEKDLPKYVTASYQKELDQIILKEKEILYQQSFQVVGHYVYQLVDEKESRLKESLSVNPVKIDKAKFDTLLSKYRAFFESSASLESMSVFREYISVESDDSRPIYVLAGREGFYPAVPLETQAAIFKEIKQFLPNFPCYTLDTSIVQQDKKIYLIASLPTSGEEVFLYYDLETNNIISINSSMYDFWSYLDAKHKKECNMVKKKRKQLIRKPVVE